MATIYTATRRYTFHTHTWRRGKRERYKRGWVYIYKAGTNELIEKRFMSEAQLKKLKLVIYRKQHDEIMKFKIAKTSRMMHLEAKEAQERIKKYMSDKYDREYAERCKVLPDALKEVQESLDNFLNSPKT